MDRCRENREATLLDLGSSLLPFYAHLLYSLLLLFVLQVSSKPAEVPYYTPFTSEQDAYVNDPKNGARSFPSSYSLSTHARLV